MTSHNNTTTAFSKSKLLNNNTTSAPINDKNYGQYETLNYDQTQMRAYPTYYNPVGPGQYSS